MTRIGFSAPEERGETSAVFARVPSEAAEKLERAAFALRRPKQEIVAALLATLDEAPVIGRATVVSPAAAEPGVLTLEEAADLLRVEVGDVLALAESGELPARRIGSGWRVSRGALLDWLAHR